MASSNARQPALRCSLFQPADTCADEATVMESYAIASADIDAALRQQIEHAGDAVQQRWLRGARHVEAFDALDDGEG